jgi:hypothetical protein
LLDDLCFSFFHQGGRFPRLLKSQFQSFRHTLVQAGSE